MPPGLVGARPRAGTPPRVVTATPSVVGVLGPTRAGWSTAEALPSTARLPSPAFVVLQRGRSRGCLQLARSLKGSPILRAVSGQTAAVPAGLSTPPPPPPYPPSLAGPGLTAADPAGRSTTPPPPPYPAPLRARSDRRANWPELRTSRSPVDPPHALAGQHIPPPTPELYAGKPTVCLTVRHCGGCRLTYAVTEASPHTHCLCCSQPTEPGHEIPPPSVPTDAMSLCVTAPTA